MNALIDIGDVCDVGSVDHRGVVIVVDDGGVHRGVRHVDVIHVSPAHVIRRDINLTRAKWEPANIHTDAEMRSTDPSDEGWSIHRADVHCADNDGARRSRHPTPEAANNNPASIVEGSKAPGSVVNPGVAPGSDVNPVPGVIRSPAGGSFLRKPNVAVLGNLAPAAIVVEVLVADD